MSRFPSICTIFMKLNWFLMGMAPTGSMARLRHSLAACSIWLAPMPRTASIPLARYIWFTQHFCRMWKMDWLCRCPTGVMLRICRSGKCRTCCAIFPWRRRNIVRATLIGCRRHTRRSAWFWFICCAMGGRARRLRPRKGCSLHWCTFGSTARIRCWIWPA